MDAGHPSTFTLALSVTSLALIGASIYFSYSYYLSKKEKLEEKFDCKVSALFIYPIKSCKGMQVDSAVVGSTGFLWDRFFMLVDEKGSFITQRKDSRLAFIVPTIQSEVLGVDPKAAPENSFMTVTAPGMDSLQVPLKALPEEEKVNTRVWGWDGHGIVVSKEVSAWFSKYLNYPAKLLRFDNDVLRFTDEKYAKNYNTTFSDGFPILLASQESLDLLNSKVENPLSMNRFRPNILVEGCEAFDEDTWLKFTIGSKASGVFRAVKPCTRCKVTRTNQETGEVEEEPVSTLKTFRSGEGMGLPAEFKTEVLFGMNVVCDFKSRNTLLTLSVGDGVKVLKRAKDLAALTPK